MKITQRQLMRIIKEELEIVMNEEAQAPASAPPKSMSAGQKRAAKAGDATSLTSWSSLAAGITDAKGLADLIRQAIEATPLAMKPAIVKTALKSLYDSVGKEPR